MAPLKLRFSSSDGAFYFYSTAVLAAYFAAALSSVPAPRPGPAQDPRPVVTVQAPVLMAAVGSERIDALAIEAGAAPTCPASASPTGSEFGDLAAASVIANAAGLAPLPDGAAPSQAAVDCRALDVAAVAERWTQAASWPGSPSALWAGLGSDLASPLHDLMRR